MNIIVGGSRTILDPTEVLVAIKDAFTKWGEKMDKDTDVILSGNSTGADTIGEAILSEMGMTIQRHPAKWNSFPKEQRNRAGSVRNQEMVDLADRAIFIWDGESRGTQNCIRMFERKMQEKPGCKIHVHRVNVNQPTTA